MSADDMQVQAHSEEEQITLGDIRAVLTELDGKLDQVIRLLQDMQAEDDAAGERTE